MTFTEHRDLVAGKTTFPSFDIIEQVLHVHKLRGVFADAVMAPRLKIVESILQAAVDNKEIDSATLIPVIAQVGPALINYHYLVTGNRQLDLSWRSSSTP